MPNTSENLAYWNETYRWPDDGDEWSGIWGGSKWMWWDVLYPRIRPFLPADTILEIAPGHGRCTTFLKDYCDKLIVVDLSPSCIETCRRRFRDSSHVLCYTNDGQSLDMIPDESVDFAFSFDSLVHVEVDVLREYVLQLGRKLKPSGAAFLHHSNLGSFPGSVLLSRGASRIFPLGFVQRLRDVGLLLAPAWRGRNVTGDLVQKISKEASLQCVTQELINWANKRHLIDCFSTFARSETPHGECAVIRNPYFLNQARQCRLRAQSFPEDRVQR